MARPKLPPEILKVRIMASVAPQTKAALRFMAQRRGPYGTMSDIIVDAVEEYIARRLDPAEQPERAAS